MTDLEWLPVTVRLGDLSHWTENPVTLSKAQAKKLLKSTERLGRMQTLAIGPQNGDGKHPLYDGHQRVNVWGAAFGMELQVNALQSSRPLTDEERHQVPIMLRTAAGSLDWDALAGWDANSLMEWGFDSDMLDGWKRDIAALGNLLESETPEPQDAEPQIDRAEELQEKWQVRMGDLWRIGEHRLLCGDSTKREDVERVTGKDMCETLTDPPYGVEFDYAASSQDDAATNDALTDAVIPMCPKPIVYTCGKRHLLRELQRWTGHRVKLLAWNKKFSMTRSGLGGADTWEIILTVDIEAKTATLPTTHLEFMTDREPGLLEGHPCPKPVALFQHLAQHLLGRFIFDPFVGSGTTIVACENLGRKCRAIEISPAYCAVTLERMSTAFPELTIERI